MNKQYYLLIFITLFLIIGNLILFYLIVGNSVFLFLGILIFFILTIGGYFYFQRIHFNRQPKLIIKQEKALQQESAIQNLQSKTIQALEKSNFIVHKRILLGEAIVIVILLFSLLLRLWQKE